MAHVGIDTSAMTAQELIPLVYEELRRVAANRMAQEQGGATLQATALVHEAYLRLNGLDDDGKTRRFNDSAHFFRAAAEVIRRILIDRARAKQSARHGGDYERCELSDNLDLAVEHTPEELLEVDALLDRFKTINPEAAEVVTLRFFVGMTTEEAAEAMGITTRTARRRWDYAKAWLAREIQNLDK